MRYIFLFLLILHFLSTFSQPEEAPWTGPIDKEAQFPGGKDSLNKFIQNNFNPECQFDTRGKLPMKVFVMLTIEKDGMISEYKIFRSNTSSYCNSHILKIFKSMPPWSPAEINGTPIRRKMIVPLKGAILK